MAKRKDIKDKVIQAETDINALSVVKEIFEYTIQLIENEGEGQYTEDGQELFNSYYDYYEGIILTYLKENK